MLQPRFALPILALVLSACATSPPVDPGPSSEMARFQTAFNAHDADGVAGLYVQDGKLLPPGRPQVTGINNVRAFWQAGFNAGVSHIEKTPVEVAVRGDLATETSHYVVTIKEQEIHGKDTLVWRRVEGLGWRIASDIWNNDK